MSSRPLQVGLPGLSGLTTLTAQQTLDAIEKALPAEQFGFIKMGGAQPDVATYFWLARCIWVDNGIQKIYRRPYHYAFY